MKEAEFYRKSKNDEVVCELCSHNCRIKPGNRGICGVRENRAGTLFSLVYGKLVAENFDPVEKKPLFHFLPGSRSYSISTVGCNFRCLHCQNFTISQFPHRNSGYIIGDERSSESIVEAAGKSGSASISYTYVEPTIFYEFARDCAQLAHKKGLKNIFVSNGYMTPQVTEDLANYLDGINIDIKAFSDKFYKKVCKARLQPVLDTVRLMHALGVWVEITTLVIPGLNDSEQELRQIAGFIKGIDPAIPWHVSAFHPTFKMTDRAATPVTTLQKARDIGLAEGLQFVYVGNIPGEGGENTFCPKCGEEQINRFGFSIQSNKLEQGKCSSCHTPIAGRW